MPKINSLEVVHQDTNKDSYQNLHDILKGLLVNQTVETIDETARAKIENLLEIYANDKESFLKSLQTLTTDFNNSNAQFNEEILLVASQLEAQAKRTSTLTAQTSNSVASVREYSEAVASDVERKVSTYSQDTAPTDNLTYGDLWYDTDDDTKVYRWNGIAWVATDDERIAKTYARWGINVTAGGQVAGIQLNADDTGTSEFTVLADNFKVYKSGNTSDPVFTIGTVNGVSAVGIKGTLLIDSSVGTQGIAGNAVTVPSFFSTTGDVNNINNSLTTILSGTITTSGFQPIVINFSSGIGGASQSGSTYYNLVDTTCWAYVYVETTGGATVSYKASSRITVDAGKMRQLSGTAMFSSSEVPAGTYVIKIKAQVVETVDGSNVKGLFARYPSFTSIETKR